MDSEIKIYKIKDLIRAKKQGTIDLDRSIKIIHELAAAACFHADCNILIDSRDTVVTATDMNSLFEITLELARFKSVFKNKIANVIPNDAERISVAIKFQACLYSKDFEYKYFTDFEDAIEWLSDTTVLNTDDISPQFEG